MKQAIKKEWIKALRSGDYEQGKRRLCKDDKWCCLGILADIAYDGDWEPKTVDISKRKGSKKRTTVIWSLGDGGLVYDSILPHSFREEIGLSNKAQTHLIEMNDQKGKSLRQIAWWIERNIRGV